MARLFNLETHNRQIKKEKCAIPLKKHRQTLKHPKFFINKLFLDKVYTKIDYQGQNLLQGSLMHKLGTLFALLLIVGVV